MKATDEINRLRWKVIRSAKAAVANAGANDTVKHLIASVHSLNAAEAARDQEAEPAEGTGTAPSARSG